MEDNTQHPDRANHSSASQTFLSLAADYFAARDCESTALLDDASTFLECAREAAATVASSLENDPSSATPNSKSAAILLYGACRFIEMAAGNVTAVNCRLIAAQRSNGST